MSQRKDTASWSAVEPNYPTCPFRNILSRIGDKWSLLILYLLNASERPLRYGELEKSIPDISSKMLSSCLRSLEADDLVARKVYAEIPPRVEYLPHWAPPSCRMYWPSPTGPRNISTTS
jgi:DNA-binding HxlR family transcriptional regulator